ncbi:hypothetical protein FSP39_015595 [Pinctada imbricata]|uniref:Shootin-1 n=1 Tax=Pinctada imbricata TaxID=66713 RepID=A0AA89BTR1_PINIB|nr:hypothetical protein FSP39_015595 [Pinctada imbricata]
MASCENGQYEKLKQLAGVVVVQYESLLQQYRQMETQYNVLVNKLMDREDQLKKMKKLVEPAIREYEMMKMKYEIEVGCRTQAEKFATKISSQNKELKRQSQMLLDLRSSTTPPDFSKLNLDLDLETEKDSVEGYNKELDEKLKKLEEELAESQIKLRAAEEDLEVEKERNERLHTKYEEKKEVLKQTRISLDQYKDAMEDLSKVSEEALREYEQLKDKYELEVKCRSGAEKYAAEIRIQNEAIKKQSTILLSSAASNPQLMMALNDIESLTTQLEEQKLKYETQIKELEEKLEEASESEAQRLDEENNQLREEKESLESKLMQYETQYKDLEKQYKEIEEKLEKALRPPPPPPPPPPPVPKSKGFLSLMKKDKKKKPPPANAGQPGVNDKFSEALDEMMQRINSGKPLSQTLRPTRRKKSDDTLDVIAEEDVKDRPSETTESSSAMAELNSILSKMKRTHSESDLGSSGQDDNKSELQKMFEKRARKTSLPKTEENVQKPHAEIGLRRNAGGQKPLSIVGEEPQWKEPGVCYQKETFYRKTVDFVWIWDVTTLDLTDSSVTS